MDTVELLKEIRALLAEVELELADITKTKE